jgi:hypothetical protein
MVSLVRAPHSGQVMVLSSSGIGLRQDEQDKTRGCRGQDAPSEPRACADSVRFAVPGRTRRNSDAADETDCRNRCQNLAVRLGGNRNRSEDQRRATEQDRERAAGRKREGGCDPASG